MAKVNNLTCAMCGLKFDSDITDEEAYAESEQYFGKWAKEDLDTVCDDCWEKIHPAKHPVEVELSNRERP